MWNKKMSYEEQLNAIKQDNDKVDENAWSMVCVVCLAVVSREECCVTTEVTPLRMRDIWHGHGFDYQPLFGKGARASKAKLERAAEIEPSMAKSQSGSIREIHYIRIFST